MLSEIYWGLTQHLQEDIAQRAVLRLGSQGGERRVRYVMRLIWLAVAQVIK